MKPQPRHLLLAALGALLFAPAAARASSHMDAPLITLDPAANTTDVYAFVTETGGTKYLTCALAVYPFEEPGIGPNKYNFDEKVVYSLNLATGANLVNGRPTLSYEFRFRTLYKTQETIAQSYLGEVGQVDDPQQNLTQHYMVQKVVGTKKTTLLLDGLVPPNNQGRVTRFYNKSDSGENTAREGVAVANSLDRYTLQTIFSTPQGYRIFAGQRDDGFYADIQSIFDLDFTFGGTSTVNKPFDSQAGFNVHTIVISIPLTEIPGGVLQNVGVWATTSRSRIFVLRNPGSRATGAESRRVQVGRQGNPLFCEGLVSIIDKDRFNRTGPGRDKPDFEKYALAPELATLLNAQPNRRTNRTDLAGIFIPDMIKVDISTPAARLAGGNTANGAVANDAGFNRLSVFGGDVLASAIPGVGNVPGGWPNGRRFGDDVLDIAVNAILNDLRTSPPTLDTVVTNVDRVTANDLGYNKVFPYAATPHNGRNHAHP